MKWLDLNNNIIERRRSARIMKEEEEGEEEWEETIEIPILTSEIIGMGVAEIDIDRGIKDTQKRDQIAEISSCYRLIAMVLGALAQVVD